MLKIIEKGLACIVVFEDMNSKERELFQQIKTLDGQENAVKYQQLSIADLSLDNESPFGSPAETPKPQKKGRPLRFIGASMKESHEQEQRAAEKKKKLDEVQEYLDCPFLDGNESKEIVKERFGYDAEKKRFLDELERE